MELAARDLHAFQENRVGPRSELGLSAICTEGTTRQVSEADWCLKKNASVSIVKMSADSTDRAVGQVGKTSAPTWGGRNLSEGSETAPRPSAARHCRPVDRPAGLLLTTTRQLRHQTRSESALKPIWPRSHPGGRVRAQPLVCLSDARASDSLPRARPGHPRHDHIDLPQRERLCEIVIGPKTDGRYGGVEGGVSGDNYDLCRRARSARRLQNAQAVRTRKMQVGQDQTELPGASVDEGDSGEAIARRGHAVTAGSEMLGEQLPDRRLVVDGEDFEPFRWLIGTWHGHCLVAAEAPPQLESARRGKT